MSSFNSVAKVMGPASLSHLRNSEWRLAITLLATALDLAVLRFAGPLAYQCASFSAAVPAAFTVLALAMFASLGHMWMSTVRAFTGNR